MSPLVSAWRVLRLAVAINRRAKVKFLLLTSLIAISTLVFLVVSELSRASTESLDEAITSDLGATGTYRIEPSPALGLTRTEVLAQLRPVAARLTREPITVVERFGEVRPECPPYNQLGAVSAIVLLDADGGPTPFRSGSLPSDADLCLAGLVIPREAIREATPTEKSAYDASIVIDPLYESLLRLGSQSPVQDSIIVITGRSVDQSDELRQSVVGALRDASLRASIPPDAAATVTRADDGDTVRAASEGIRVVYGLIGWGVLLIGGIGILVAELIVLRDRTWFFGLARAVGAKRWSIAWLVLADILLVILCGLGLAVGALLAMSSTITSFGHTAFQTQLQVLRPSTFPTLAAGLLLVLVLGGAYPATRAARLDPLDVLERH